MFLKLVTGKKLSFLVVKNSISLEEMKLANREKRSHDTNNFDSDDELEQKKLKNS